MARKTRNSLSIIVPTFNEEKNISRLIAQIDKALKKASILYEVIVVDDHSTDKTVSNITKLSHTYPVRLFLKKGKKGKAFSLLEGFGKAKHKIVAMIDADLQYPPSRLPAMLSEIEEGSDIVIGNRISKNASVLRTCMSKAFRFVFVSLLFGESFDAQSGMKVFRKEILKKIDLHPSKWSFDLEFLVKAQHGGYAIASVDIPFTKRKLGDSKINLFSSAVELGLASLKLKASTPFVTESLKKGKRNGFHAKGLSFIHHANLPIDQTAFYLLSTWQKIALIVFGGLVIFSFILNWHTTLLVFIAVTTFLYLIDLVFNLTIIYRSFSKDPEIAITKRQITASKNRTWPTYTIMCPLYKEWRVLPQFIKAMEALDYRKDRLQVLFLLEKNDKTTIRKVQEYKLPSNFQIVVVPESKPKTKPKALNYGLNFAKGEYLVVYDAEDVPDPMQLKKAILAFEQQGRNVVCVQAKLNFYNPHQNLLTRMFAAEYSLWFDLVLTGLQTIHAPIPLGGTSNHFRKKDIVLLGGWDSFNVTEDADLGMRLAKKGFKTVLINSYTMEEANSEISNWFRQRSRWIKGYIQTYIVHMRNPMEFIHDFRKPHAISFQIIVGGKVLSMLINPIMWVTTISYFAFRPTLGPFIETFFPGPIFYMAVVSLVVGNFLYTYYYMLGIARRKEWDLIPFSLLTPIYWLFMSAAAVFALYEIIYRPHYWHKTKHGLHLPKLALENDSLDIDTPKKRFAFLPA